MGRVEEWVGFAVGMTLLVFVFAWIAGMLLGMVGALATILGWPVTGASISLFVAWCVWVDCGDRKEQHKAIDPAELAKAEEMARVADAAQANAPDLMRLRAEARGLQHILSGRRGRRRPVIRLAREQVEAATVRRRPPGTDRGSVERARLPEPCAPGAIPESGAGPEPDAVPGAKPRALPEYLRKDFRAAYVMGFVKSDVAAGFAVREARRRYGQAHIPYLGLHMTTARGRVRKTAPAGSSTIGERNDA